MSKPFVSVSGSPGKLATATINAIANSGKICLANFSLTGLEFSGQVRGGLNLIGPEQRLDYDYPEIGMVLDATLAGPLPGNVKFYCAKKWPMIIATSGGDWDLMTKEIEAAKLPALRISNAAIPVGALIAYLNYLVDEQKFSIGPPSSPNVRLRVLESHQETKPDTSNTAREISNILFRMGFKDNSSEMVRNKIYQKALFGIEDSYAAGHGLHFYEFCSDRPVDMGMLAFYELLENFFLSSVHLKGMQVIHEKNKGVLVQTADGLCQLGLYKLSKDMTSDFAFFHKIKGRDIYGQGFLKFIEFEQSLIDAGKFGVFGISDYFKYVEGK